MIPKILRIEILKDFNILCCFNTGQNFEINFIDYFRLYLDNEVLKRTGAQDGDLIFFGADKEKIVNDAIGALRIKIGHSEFGKKNNLFEKAWRPMWVVDFPMF